VDDENEYGGGDDFSGRRDFIDSMTGRDGDATGNNSGNELENYAASQMSDFDDLGVGARGGGVPKPSVKQQAKEMKNPHEALIDLIKKLDPFAFVNRFWRKIQYMPGISKLCRQLDKIVFKLVAPKITFWGVAGLFILSLGKFVFRTVEALLDLMSNAFQKIFDIIKFVINVVFKLPIVKTIVNKIKELYIKTLKKIADKAKAAAEKATAGVRKVADAARSAVAVADRINRIRQGNILQNKETKQMKEKKGGG